MSAAAGVRLPFGLAFQGDYLYVDLTARSAPERLPDLPTGGHSSRNVVFNSAGTKLYIAVGCGGRRRDAHLSVEQRNVAADGRGESRRVQRLEGGEAGAHASPLHGLPGTLASSPPNTG